MSKKSMFNAAESLARYLKSTAAKHTRKTKEATPIDTKKIAASVSMPTTPPRAVNPQEYSKHPNRQNGEHTTIASRCIMDPRHMEGYVWFSHKSDKSREGVRYLTQNEHSLVICIPFVHKRGKSDSKENGHFRAESFYHLKDSTTEYSSDCKKTLHIKLETGDEFIIKANTQVEAEAWFRSLSNEHVTGRRPTALVPGALRYNGDRKGGSDPADISAANGTDATIVAIVGTMKISTGDGNNTSSEDDEGDLASADEEVGETDYETNKISMDDDEDTDAVSAYVGTDKASADGMASTEDSATEEYTPTKEDILKRADVGAIPEADKTASASNWAPSADAAPACSVGKGVAVTTKSDIPRARRPSVEKVAADQKPTTVDITAAVTSHDTATAPDITAADERAAKLPQLDYSRMQYDCDDYL